MNTSTLCGKNGKSSYRLQEHQQSNSCHSGGLTGITANERRECVHFEDYL
ncbi:hypothetical protein CP03DC29_0358A, partial [Chlamydia psittaci 03DC29]